MRLSQVRRSSFWALVVALGLAGCETTTAEPLPDPPAPPPPQIRVELVEPGVDGIVDEPTLGPVVRAVNVDGSPAVGVTVNFAALNGGSLQATSVTTDAAGLATPGLWTLGPRPGTQWVSAVAVGPGIRTSVLAELPED